MHEKNIGLVGLLETKVQGKNAGKIASMIFQGWNWHHNFNLSTKERIWVAWQLSLYVVHIIFMADQLIHCKVTQVQVMKQFYLTVIYGANQEAGRRLLWEGLIAIANNMDELGVSLETLTLSSTKEIE